MDVFGTRLRASEGAYFKTEAERDLERLAAERRRRRRRADEATTMELDGRVDESVASETSTTSRARAAHEYAMRGNATRGGVDKLASVYAEETRLAGTNAGAGEVRVRRTVGRDDDDALPVMRARTRDSIFFAHGGASKLNRRDWMREVSADLRRAAAERAAMSPMERKALEVSHRAQRHAMMGGVRALAYGSVLALVGVVGGSAAASAMLRVDARGEEDFGENFKSTFSPYVDRARTAAGPYREWVASVGQDATEGGAASVERSAVVQNLRKRLRVARPAQSTST